MRDIKYQASSDSIRRLLIRYCSPCNQVMAEYIPQMINSKILAPAFTPTDLYNSFENIGVPVSSSSIYSHVTNPYNPIIGKVADNEQVAQSTIFQCKNPKKAYYLRPLHKMHKMVKEIAYFREYEIGHSKLIPHYEVFEDILNSEDMSKIMGLYEQIKWRPSARKHKWINDYYYYIDISNPMRTPIDDNIVTKPSMFKIAFFDAVMTEGNYSLQDIQRATGIHPDTLSTIIKHSKHVREERRFVVEAKSPWDALKKVGERGYAKHLGDNKYLIQLPSRLRERRDGEVDIDKIDKNLSPPEKPKINVYKDPRIAKKHLLPQFQRSFLLKSIRKVYRQAFEKEPPLTNDVQELLDYIKKI